MLEEKILLKFCAKERTDHGGDPYRADPLELIKRVCPELLNEFAGKEICDFGCGTGSQAAAFAKTGAKMVVGIDTNMKRIKEAQEQYQGISNLSFFIASDGVSPGQFDVVISQNSMEHFPDPQAAFMEMASLLKPNGKYLVTFGPPWFAPYGAHMQFFTQVPWVHLLFSEKAIMNVRRRYTFDGARRYEDVESGLNKMSLSKFRKIVQTSGLTVIFKKYDCVKGMNGLGSLPILNEFFINHVTYLLLKPTP